MSEQEAASEAIPAREVEFDQADQDLFAALERRAGELDPAALTPFQARMLREVMIIRDTLDMMYFESNDRRDATLAFFDQMKNVATLVDRIAIQVDA